MINANVQEKVELLSELDNFFAHQPLWLVVFQSYEPLSIFTGHNFDIDTMEKTAI